MNFFRVIVSFSRASSFSILFIMFTYLENFRWNKHNLAKDRDNA